MSRQGFEAILNKKKNFLIRVTGFLKGENKNKFIDDCALRGYGESKMLKHITDVYYSIPNVQGMEMTEIKKLISERIVIK